MPYADIISIGIAARNEEKTIAQTLLSLEKSILVFPNHVAFEVIIAINGCTDSTESIVNRIKNQNTNERINFVVTHSPEGLIEAHRAILAASQSDDYVIFLDADLIIDQRCILELASAMEKNRSLRVAWANILPYDHVSPVFPKLVLNFTDYFPQTLTQRKYFSGRAFATRGYNTSYGETNLNKLSPKLVAFLRLREGPLIDDVLLSRTIFYEKGPSAIKFCKEARVFFQPIGTLKDFYYSQRRTVIERYRISILFPQLKAVPRSYYKRTPQKEYLSGLSPRIRITHRCYTLLYKMARKVAYVEFGYYRMLLFLGVPLQSCRIWPALRSTKKEFIVNG